jgi:hypothetical protein
MVKELNLQSGEGLNFLHLQPNITWASSQGM